MLGNPFWHALRTEHAGMALGRGRARRYPAEVLPFGGLEGEDAGAMRDLAGLLEPGEAIYVTGDRLPEVAELERVSELPGWQMRYSAGAERAEVEGGLPIEALGAEDAGRMVALKEVAFPGYFGVRTVELGTYFGISVGGQLVAMAGERAALPGSREVSAVCTHPEHRGRGYAEALTRHLLRCHAGLGLESFLHVAAANVGAIRLYERLGFWKARPMLFTQLRRTSAR